MGSEAEPLVVLICGDRDWPSSRNHEIEDAILDLPQDAVIVCGGCRGVDLYAEEIARVHDHPVKVYPAQWERFGRAAGPIRNQEMLDREHPDLVIAFHPDLTRSCGTKDMVAKARKVGIPVRLLGGVG